MVIKEGTFEAKKVFEKKRLTWVCAPLVVNCIINPRTGQQARVMTFSRALQLKSSSCFVLFSPHFCLALLSVHFSFVCLMPSVQVWFMVGCCMISGFYVSRDQAAVNAAGSQSPLQSPLLSLRSQNGDDGLVKHCLQALLGQR